MQILSVVLGKFHFPPVEIETKLSIVAPKQMKHTLKNKSPAEMTYVETGETGEAHLGALARRKPICGPNRAPLVEIHSGKWQVE